MVDPIVTPIIGLCFMGFLVVNALASSLTRFVPWIIEKINEGDPNREPISKTDAGDYLAMFLFKVDEWKKLNPQYKKVATTPLVVNFSNGVAIFDVPAKGCTLEFNKIFKVETIFYEGMQTISGILVFWESEDAVRAQSYLSAIKKSIDIRTKSQ